MEYEVRNGLVKPATMEGVAWKVDQDDCPCICRVDQLDDHLYRERVFTSDGNEFTEDSGTVVGKRNGEFVIWTEAQYTRRHWEWWRIPVRVGYCSLSYGQQMKTHNLR